MNDDEPLLPTTLAAHYLSVDPGTMKRWRTRGDGPPYVKISVNRCRYSLGELKKWTAERTRRNTADPGPGRAA